MKHIFLFLSAVTLLLTTSCGKKAIVIPPTPPNGVFSGKFLYVHRKTTALPYDTLKANIILTVQSPANTFAVTGDTTTVHAGSHGFFSFNYGFIVFSDKTYPVDGSIPPKFHLSGTYQYYYDGTVLQMLGSSSDTAVYEYSLTRN